MTKISFAERGVERGLAWAALNEKARGYFWGALVCLVFVGVYLYYAAFPPAYFVAMHGDIDTAVSVARAVAGLCLCVGAYFSTRLAALCKQ